MSVLTHPKPDQTTTSEPSARPKRVDRDPSPSTYESTGTDSVRIDAAKAHVRRQMSETDEIGIVVPTILLLCTATFCALVGAVWFW